MEGRGKEGISKKRRRKVVRGRKGRREGGKKGEGRTDGRTDGREGERMGGGEGFELIELFK